MNVLSKQPPATERWLWRFLTVALLGLAAGLVVVGFTLYV